MKEEFLTKDVKPENIFVYVFNTENKKQPVRKFGIKEGNDVTWYKNMGEFRGRYKIKTKGDMLVSIYGKQDSGVEVRMPPQKLVGLLKRQAS